MLPHTALDLMRSRYAAYALCLPEYIIRTTHPTNQEFESNTKEWEKKISQFCLTTKFLRLEILHFEEKKLSATVTFTAYLTQNKKDVSFTEKSYFEKVEGKWLYRSGEFLPNP